MPRQDNAVRGPEGRDHAKPVFRDRRHAGQVLARLMSGYANRPDVIVLALPRGGVPVAFEVARALRTPLDVLIVRKLGVPGHEEYAMGAIASGGVRVLNRNVLSTLQIPEATVEAVTQSEQRELERREHLYRDDRPAADVRGLAVLLVDDGLATGSTMLAAVKVLRQQQATRIVAAVPLGSPDTCEDLRHAADEVICATTPQPFHAVSCWYEDFSQTSDDEVRELLARTRNDAAHAAQASLQQPKWKTQP